MGVGLVLRFFRNRAVIAVLTVAAAVAVWLSTRNAYLLLPFAGVLVGLSHRREKYASLFGQT